MAHSTPRLWTTLSFTLEKPTEIPILQAINNWLQLSDNLPLTICIFHYIQRQYFKQACASPEICEPVIDALNQHSGRWGQVVLSLPPRYFSRFCGTSPLSHLYDLRVINCGPLLNINAVSPIFRMNSKPSPTNLTIQNFRLSAIDIGWSNLTTLVIGGMTINERMEVIQRAPLLESCTLLDFSPFTHRSIPKTICISECWIPLDRRRVIHQPH